MKPLVTNLWRLAAVAALSWAHLSQADLIHRYSFTANANDSVGTAHGVALQTSTAGTPNGTPITFEGGVATLDGVGGYIDLPNGLISANTNITIEMWVSWQAGGGAWQRVFDFGIGTLGEDTDGSLSVGNGAEYMFFTPSAGGGNARFTIQDTGTGETATMNHSQTLYSDPGVDTHVVIVYTTNYARLIVNGVQVGTATTSVPLANLNDVNVWLGRSMYNSDGLFQGSYNEFRIYNHPLNLPQVLANGVAGPDSTNATPLVVTSISMTGGNSMFIGEVQTPSIIGDFVDIGQVNLGTLDVTMSSANSNVVTITSLGTIQAVGEGTTTVTASLGGQTSSFSITVTATAPYLVNRYSFNNPAGSDHSAVITDSVGGRDGFIVPGTNFLAFDGSGVTFPPVDNYARASYIDLGAGLLKERTNITVETWYTWNGNNVGANTEVWQRVFDFGDSGKGTSAFNAGNGLGYVTLTPRNGGGRLQIETRTPAPNAGLAITDPAGPSVVGQQVHVVAVFAPKSQSQKIYVNGVLVASGGIPSYTPAGAPVPETFSFADPNFLNLNNWLGQSQWGDPAFKGKINELRIHEGVLDDLTVALSTKAGPDALPVVPGNLVSVSLSPVTKLLARNPATVQAEFLGNFQNVTGVLISGVSGVSFTSTDTNIFAVGGTGLITSRAVGTADLIASYQGQSKTTTVEVLAPATLTQLGVATNLISGSLNVVSVLQADYAGTNGVNASGFTGVTRSSSDTNVFTVTGAGAITPRAPGTAVLTAVYPWIQGGVTNALTNQVTVTVAAPAGFIKGTLVNRYSFNEAIDAVTVLDSVSGSNGTLMGVIEAGVPTNNFTGTGAIRFAAAGNAGAPGSAYVDLPNGLISKHTAVTVEGWVTRSSTAANQRIFDFGRSTTEDGLGGFLEDAPGTGAGYFFLDPNTTRFAMKTNTADETPSLTSPVVIPSSGALTHFAVVYDQPSGVVRIYINGIRTTAAAATLPLIAVNDINCWLGRSQWGGDPMFGGTIEEFRIYNGPLLDSDVAASFAAGPDAISAGPAPTLAIGKTGANIEITWPESASGYVLQAAGQLGGSFLPAGVTPTTNAGVVKATIPVPTGATNSFFQLKK